ncbi:murein transglycosylase A [Alcaligenes endophyticus]|uniref:peptidoglycan lytic exotransglycosylase n=1 Tax=Alcaligenes endophyticus TaxID=1929088 RepID=A0ABT8ELH2_9BURK|nr:MltA domain-containing protein [Alcaligenes endophyticus]MCX5591276.1 MltA domain-containing protein [Alcaligenes endophyticus]MDN4122146.1 murein transglycosylase A [Alcaligenes endophyticus]
MKVIYVVATLSLLLSACSSVVLEPSTGSSTTTPSAGTDPELALQPLRVPSLDALPETPARALKGKYVAVEWSVLPGWQTDQLDHVWKGFVNNCKGLMRPVSGSLVTPARASPRAWQPVCAAAKSSGLGENSQDTQAIRQFLQTHLRPWRLLNANGQAASGTVTGYYEPLLKASRQRSGQYQWPLFAAPDDLLTIDLGGLYPELAGKRVRGKQVGNRVVPYDARADIVAKADRQPPVIVWAEDPIEGFFLQIQGSGRAVLPDGSAVRLAYADHNGRPYASIGQWLAKQGELPLAQTSMQNIKAWAKRNPHRAQELMNVNTAMVFFREEPIVDPELGPKGAYGIPLIAERAIAVDPTFVPLGTPVFLSTTYPASQQPLQRLVFAQDTGAAITGAARADFYWGTGDEAGNKAGRMKQTGGMWLLWPRQAGAPGAR